ncbi:hypothetical protein Tco_0876680 [Tanacetum coccineum]|uniref:Reverse transcriptase domain-containing protein n=1 Tax=Tanacetum coccineum TaxID=301880 RepID=A0ABQ5BUP2_9ASTR
MRQRRRLELLVDYDYEIHYHPGKANVIADVLSQKEQIKPLRFRSLMSESHLAVLNYVYIHPPYYYPTDSYIEDAFSSTTTPNYILASLDYSLASPGNTSFDSSEDLSKDLSASLTISPFHDDPYMKVMQAYNATSNESPIPLPRAPIAPPTILPPSPVLPSSPLFDLQDFFLLEEILPPQKRARFLSSFSTDSFALPQEFEIGESSHKTHLERHEEQIETILNHLDQNIKTLILTPKTTQTLNQKLDQKP